jgi:hypothetical protein
LHGKSIAQTEVLFRLPGYCRIKTAGAVRGMRRGSASIVNRTTAAFVFLARIAGARIIAARIHNGDRLIETVYAPNIPLFSCEK